MHDRYENPLIARYASAEMARLWGDQRKFSTWRRLWVALAEAERELGLAITAEQIATFCTTKYAITFPLFEKVATKGAGQSPVYAFLTKGHGEPRWNFHKYLVGKDGQVVAAFPSKVAPESTELRGAIDQALAK